jgi:dephospho-CoA kinase
MTIMVRRLAVVGKSGAGKSTAAELIASIHGFRRVSTGVICRQIATSLFGNDHKASTQRIDDALTAIDSSIFLKAALRDIDPDERICVDSLRFNSDLEFARQEGFLVVRVVAPDGLRAKRLAERGQVFDPAVDGRHRSETELDGVEVDFEIVNDGSVETMKDAIAAIFAEAE